MSQEPESIISFTIARAIREQPEQAAAEMLRLIRVEAELQAEVARLKERFSLLEPSKDEEWWFGYV